MIAVGSSYSLRAWGKVLQSTPYRLRLRGRCNPRPLPKRIPPAIPHPDIRVDGKCRKVVQYSILRTEFSPFGGQSCYSHTPAGLYTHAPSPNAKASDPRSTASGTESPGPMSARRRIMLISPSPGCGACRSPRSDWLFKD
jgi:hypothetical protein